MSVTRHEVVLWAEMRAAACACEAEVYARRAETQDAAGKPDAAAVARANAMGNQRSAELFGFVVRALRDPEPSVGACATCEAVAQRLLSTHYYHMATPALLAQAVEFLAADERRLRELFQVPATQPHDPECNCTACLAALAMPKGAPR